MATPPKQFRVTLHVVQETVAEDEDEALGIFWDELHFRQAEEEPATVEEVDSGGTR